MWLQEPPKFTAKDGDLMEYTVKLARKTPHKGRRDIAYTVCDTIIQRLLMPSRKEALKQTLHETKKILHLLTSCTFIQRLSLHREQCFSYLNPISTMAGQEEIYPGFGAQLERGNI